MAPQRIPRIGDAVHLPSGRRATVVVAAISNRPWIAVEVEGKWAVRRDGEPFRVAGYAGLDETDARALAKLLNQVGVR